MIVTSVVIPAFGAWSTLPGVLDALEPQIGPEREVILVDSSGGNSAEHAERRWPWLRVVALPRRALPGQARNIGARIARGAHLAFLDADAVPDRDWLLELERALAPHVDAVAGAVVNGTPRSIIGTAGYLLEFSELLPGPPRRPAHGATCNLLVRRDAFESAGGFPEDIFPGEDTVFTFPIARRGGLVFAPSARVRHLNRCGFRAFLAHQHRLGTAFSHVCARVEVPYRAMARPVLVPVAPLLRLITLGMRLVRNPRQAGSAVLVLPLLAVGLAAWATGVVRGGR